MEKREKWISNRTYRKLTDSVKRAVKDAVTLDDLHSALGPVIDGAATPDLVPAGAMVLQPSEERRRSGSHYTPRALTEPIVRTTLEPILARLRGADGRPPRPEEILDLKVCDPAMGSGAFLVEACRQLGDALLESWHVGDELPVIPPDEDEVIFARRLIAQRCLYGLDRNPIAVDLAKMSLWLVTLAKDHALTFLDHALRHGDSLVGLSRKQIEAFHWDPDAALFEAGFETMAVREHVAEVAELRKRIREAHESVSDRELHELWDEAQVELGKVRLFGDLVLAAFFEGDKAREREGKRVEYASAVVSGEAGRHRGRLDEWRHVEVALAPFHWELEFPEVFDRTRAGFDTFVGNPPFMGGRKISTALGLNYLAFLHACYPRAANTCDLVAYFFRRAFALLREQGTLGLIATNTIAQGDTRDGGLGEIRRTGGLIYSATSRYPWPGTAGVVVSIVHIQRGGPPLITSLNGSHVSTITAFLLSAGPDEPPLPLPENKGLQSVGSFIYGRGFLFDDADDQATPLSVATEILSRKPELTSRIRPYIGGDDLNSHPTIDVRRFVINLSDLPSEASLTAFPELEAIVRARVKPARERLGDNPVNRPLKRRWWAYQAHRPDFYLHISSMSRLLAICRVSKCFAFTFVQPGPVFGESVVLIALESDGAFAVLQSRAHEIWAKAFSSTLGDALRYAPTDCFETFPFPDDWQTNSDLGLVGRKYFAARAALMARSGEGLTNTYNRFHDPDELSPEVAELRFLHTAMDRAILDAYGWRDLPSECEFLLDYEISEEEWGNKKKPYQYRWPDDVRDEVLARLLKLNSGRVEDDGRPRLVTAKDAGALRAKPLGAVMQTEELF